MRILQKSKSIESINLIINVFLWDKKLNDVGEELLFQFTSAEMLKIGERVFEWKNQCIQEDSDYFDGEEDYSPNSPHMFIDFPESLHLYFQNGLWRDLLRDIIFKEINENNFIHSDSRSFVWLNTTESGKDDYGIWLKCIGRELQ